MYRTIPYSDQIVELDLDKDNQIRFTWRGDKFVVRTTGLVESVDGCFLKGDNISILMEQLIKLELYKMAIKDESEH